MSDPDHKPDALTKSESLTESKPKRDPRTGQILPGGPSLNPRGSRRKGHRKYLAQLIGESGELAYDGILRIAQGLETFETLAREPGPDEDIASVALIPKVRKFPSIRERLDAWQILAEHLNGKPSVDVDVTHHAGEPVGARDYSKLSDAELEQLERFLTMTEGARAPEVVEGEIVNVTPHLPEKAKP
jgi:hypothetical protein